MRSNGMSKISGEELAVKEIVSPRSIETSAGVAFGKDITGSFERLEAAASSSLANKISEVRSQ
jgi:hypothetical protein